MLPRLSLPQIKFQAVANYWLMPSLLTLGALALALVTILIDRGAVGAWLNQADWVFRTGPEGARLTLSTIAGSMITVASLVFSLTLLALTLASQQFGPRLLARFLQDRATQVVLGVFIATFVYALLVMQAVTQAPEPVFVPHLSMIAAIVFAIASFGVLIYFIHHVSTGIQADAVVAGVVSDLKRTVDVLCEGLDDARYPEPGDPPADGAVLAARRSGYVQSIDFPALVTAARAHGARVDLNVRVGHFVIRDGLLAQVSPPDAADALADLVDAAIVTGDRRTLAQDVELSLRNLVEVAVRALSPSLNDHNTAIACIDRLGECLAHLMDRQLPGAALADESEGGAAGAIRVVHPALTHEIAIATAFNEIRQSAQGNPPVMMRLVDQIGRLAPHVRGDAQRAALHDQLQRIEESAGNLAMAGADREGLERRLTSARDKLDAKT